MIGKYLSNTDYATLQDISISNEFALYNLKQMQICNKSIFVVFHGNTAIGILNVSLIEGKYYSTYRQIDSKCIQKLFDDNSNVAFGCYENESLIFDGESFYSTETDLLFENDFSGIDSIQLKPLEITYDQISSTAGNNARSISYSLADQMVIVPNTYKNSEGICWAASIAMKYNFENGYNKGLMGYVDAVNVYDCLKRELGYNPAGNTTCVKAGLGHFGMYDTYYKGDVSATAVVAEIYNDNPILASLKGTSDLTHTTIYHSVVICGVTYNSDDSAIYEIADSNTTTIQLAYVDSNASSSSADFIYSPDYLAEYYSWYQVYSYLPDNTHITD